MGVSLDLIRKISVIRGKKSAGINSPHRPLSSYDAPLLHLAGQGLGHIPNGKENCQSQKERARADDDGNDRFNHCRHVFQRIIDLHVVKINHLVQHVVQTAGFFAHGNEAGHHRREYGHFV